MSWDCARAALAPAETGAGLPTLAGLDWSECDGQVALIDVATGEGSLQEWGRRGTSDRREVAS